MSVSSALLDLLSHRAAHEPGGPFAYLGVNTVPPFLVTEELAVVWTGRPASTIRRWAAEGRITRHGHGRGNIRYDLAELHAKTENEDGTVTPGRAPQMPTAHTRAA